MQRPDRPDLKAFPVQELELAEFNACEQHHTAMEQRDAIVDVVKASLRMIPKAQAPHRSCSEVCACYKQQKVGHFITPFT